MVLCLCGSVVYAETTAPVDVSAMTEDELVSLIDEARTALSKLRAGITKDSVLFENEFIRISYAGTVELTEYGELQVDVVVENLSESNLGISVDNASCNGWAVSCYISNNSVPAGKKAKLSLNAYDIVNTAELEKVEDLDNIEGDFRIYDTDSYDTVAESAAFSWNF